MRKVERVLLHVMHQDPTVVVESGGAIWAIQPVIATSRAGFRDGPACDRVAVVDLPAPGGHKDPPVKLVQQWTSYNKVWHYDVPSPIVPGGRRAGWSRGPATVELRDIYETESGRGFIKVSTFGTVVRTIGLIEDPVILGKRVRWAFGDGPILVISDAGRLENAFYDRGSHSLQFFAYDRPETGRRYYTALSQDIITHEVAHALIDGIAPDLYDAGSPQSLAIHESVADMTAVMIGLRSRDPYQSRPEPEVALRSLLTSSRYSRVAEEFGRSRGAVDALRDAANDRTLDRRVRAPEKTVDRLSPHSLGQVLTGALFSVLRSAMTGALDDLVAERPNAQIQVSGKDAYHDPFRMAALYAVNRVGSMIFKGMEWLPPGEVTFADAVRAMLAADQVHHSDLPAERNTLKAECARRGIAARAALGSETSVSEPYRLKISPQTLLNDAEKARRFVAAHRDRFGIPLRSVEVTTRRSAVLTQPLLQERHVLETFTVDPAEPATSVYDQIVILKVAWWERHTLNLPQVGASTGEYKTGVSIVLDHQGQLLALLHATSDARFIEDRTDYLRRLVDQSMLVTSDTASESEDVRQVRADLDERILRLAGALRALHPPDGSH